MRIIFQHGKYISLTKVREKLCKGKCLGIETYQPFVICTDKKFTVDVKCKFKNLICWQAQRIARYIQKRFERACSRIIPVYAGQPRTHPYIPLPVFTHAEDGCCLCGHSIPS